MLLCYIVHVIMLLRYYVITLLRYYVIMLLCYYVIILFSYFLIVLLFYYIVLLLFYILLNECNDIYIYYYFSNYLNFVIDLTFPEIELLIYGKERWRISL